MRSTLRTKSTFEMKSQIEHHLGSGKSPLLDIPGFDPIKSMFLDSMHLIYLEVMKWIMQQLIGTKKVSHKCKLSAEDIKCLNLKFKILVNFITKEFQRKKFDIHNFAHWKATQFRFFLHYCGSLVLHNILPSQMYKHFLLLVVACRILCDPQVCLDNVNYARELLRKFFELTPSFYGTGSQVMNIHNLIHLADDVEYTKMSLSTISAFPFENHLGKIKRQNGGRNNTLGQLARRVSEQNACPKLKNKNAIKKKVPKMNFNTMLEDDVNFEDIMFQGVTLSIKKPDDIVKMCSGHIFKITRIRKVQHNFFLQGYMFMDVNDVFQYPCASSKVGIMKLGRISTNEETISLENIVKKCVLFESNDNTFAITYLHDS